MPALQLQSDVTAEAAALRGTFTGLVRRKGISPADTEDIVQDFYLRVVLNASSLRTRDKLRPWLSRVLWSATIDHLRERQARLRVEAAGRLAALTAARDAPSTDSEEVEHRCVQVALLQVKREYAETIQHIDLAGESATEFALSHGESVNNIRVRLCRARRALRERIVAQYPSCPSCVG